MLWQVNTNVNENLWHWTFAKVQAKHLKKEQYQKRTSNYSPGMRTVYNIVKGLWMVQSAPRVTSSSSHHTCYNTVHEDWCLLLINFGSFCTPSSLFLTLCIVFLTFQNWGLLVTSLYLSIHKLNVVFFLRRYFRYNLYLLENSFLLRVKLQLETIIKADRGMKYWAKILTRLWKTYRKPCSVLRLKLLWLFDIYRKPPSSA